MDSVNELNQHVQEAIGYLFSQPDWRDLAESASKSPGNFLEALNMLHTRAVLGDCMNVGTRSIEIALNMAIDQAGFRVIAPRAGAVIHFKDGTNLKVDHTGNRTVWFKGEKGNLFSMIREEWDDEVRSGATVTTDSTAVAEQVLAALCDARAALGRDTPNRAYQLYREAIFASVTAGLRCADALTQLPVYEPVARWRRGQPGTLAENDAFLASLTEAIDDALRIVRAEIAQPELVTA